MCALGSSQVVCWDLVGLELASLPLQLESLTSIFLKSSKIPTICLFMGLGVSGTLTWNDCCFKGGRSVGPTPVAWSFM